MEVSCRAEVNARLHDAIPSLSPTVEASQELPEKEGSYFGVDTTKTEKGNGCENMLFGTRFYLESECCFDSKLSSRPLPSNIG